MAIGQEDETGEHGTSGGQACNNLAARSARRLHPRATLESPVAEPVLESGRTSSQAGDSPFFRCLLPREHGLIAWVLQPLWLGWLLARGVMPATAAVLAVLAGFGAFNALRVGRRGPAAVALVGAAAGLFGALWGSAQPWPWLTLAAGGGLALVLGRSSRALPRVLGFELAGLAVLCAAGALVAVGAGASVTRALAASGVLYAWEVLGLCWVRGQLARILPRREPVPHAAYVAFAVTMSAAVTAMGFGYPALAAVPLLYGLRVIVHPAPTRAADAKRVGLTELAWGLAAALLLAIR
jgi:hypothetical protein